MSNASSFSSRRSAMSSMGRDSSIHEGAPYGCKVIAKGKDPAVDIIAIHGLDGHREKSWTAKNGVLWLRDFLPNKIPNARIVAYGYDANTHGKEKLTKQFLHGHAMTFLSHLEHFRAETSTEDRPIIFIAHSLGGILLKSALIELALSSAEHLPDRLAIASSVYAIFFIGTPHQGTELAEFGRAVLKMRSVFTQTNDVLLRLLKKDSELIQHQLSQFAAISGKFKIKYFYEMYETEVAPGIKRLASIQAFSCDCFSILILRSSTSPQPLFRAHTVRRLDFTRITSISSDLNPHTIATITSCHRIYCPALVELHPSKLIFEGKVLGMPEIRR